MTCIMALHRAVLQGRPQQVKYLLGTRNFKYNGINAKDDGSKTPLILTCQVEQIKIAICIARLLLKKGAQVGISDKDGRNALSHACTRRRHELVKLFLTEVDYDLNMVDGDGNSPLHHAAISGDVDIVREMVTVFKKNHSSVDLSNKSGETPLMIASKLGFISCAEVLITVGLASLTKRDNVNFMNALEWAQTNTANDNVNLSNIYCRPKQNNSPRSSSALNKLVGSEDDMTNNEEDEEEEEDENTKSMKKCLSTAYRIYEVQNSTSYRISSMSPIKPTPAILTSFFDFHKDGTYSIEDVMWLVSKGKTVSNNGIPKSLIRRHTDSRLSPRSALKPSKPGNASVLESMSLDLDSRLNGIQPDTVTAYLDTSDSDLDSDDVFYSGDSDEIYSSDTKGRQRKAPKQRRRMSSQFERSDSGIQESATADSSDEQSSENNRPNTRSDSFLTPVTVAKQRIGMFTDIRILKVMKSPNRSPEPTWRMSKTTDELLLRPEGSPTRQYRANSDSAIDTKAFISRTGSDYSALNAKALSSPSIARWQNAVCEIRSKIQNNVRFNLESRSSTRNSRPRTGMSTRTNSVQSRKDHVVCRRNSESNKYAARNLEDDQEYGNSQSTNGRKTRSRNKKITLDSPGSNSMGQKQKRETRREWKRQQEVESEKRRNDLNRKIDLLRSELGKMDARWRARKYHPQLPENILSNINNDLENASRRTPGAQSEVTNRRTPAAQSEEEMEVADTLSKTPLISSNMDVRFNAFDSRLSWSAKCPTDSSLTSSISLPSLGWSSSSEDLLRSEEFEKEGISCSSEIDKLQKQGRKQRLRQISSIRRPAQAPNQIGTDSSRRPSEYGRFDANTLRITVPRNPVTRAKTTRGSNKRHVRQFQQHP